MFATRLNSDLLENNYVQWKENPKAVDPEWSAFFEGFELGTAQPPKRNGAGLIAPEPRGAAVVDRPPAAAADLQTRIDSLVYAYRTLGHTIARTDPLADDAPEQPLLELKEFNLAQTDPDTPVSSKFFMGGEVLPLRELVDRLQSIYGGPIGAEFIHIQNPRVRNFVRDRFENPPPVFGAAPEVQLRILRTLMEAETFERFLHTKYVGQKRFSLEGGESLMVALDTILQACPAYGVQEIVMGMAHRGRLTVLANFIKKPLKVLFTEFSENYIPNLNLGDGDVKYHLGYETVRTTLDGHEVRVALAANPSHLEAVNPVVQGKARARQRVLDDTIERKRVLPLLLHGDAAVAGQGIVAEVLNMSQLPGYRTGGTVHIVVNNQIGFTTLPADARSSQYATDVAKMIEAPIFHVNADDPLAVYYVTQLAFELRQVFGRDVFVDLVCYRRHGHNEGDEPVFTQPNLYDKIARHPSTWTLYKARLAETGVLSEDAAKEEEQEYKRVLERAREEVREIQASDAETPLSYSESTAEFQPPYSHDPVDTAISREMLERIVRGLTSVPEDFKVLPKVKRLLLDRRRAIFDNGGPYDWAYAEALAFGSLLVEGAPVRLSGQDSRRGTFSQRHSVLYDANTRERYIPLMNLAERQAKFCVYNSLLSEAAVLGFDYGYSLGYPDMLCLWEAQFGDFCNGGQVIIDQFIASAESKWQVTSGIVLLLPHGYEGAGPEHSSARLERFLTLCAENNMQVCNLTTPAQYFHALRRQVKRPFRKPLVIMTPKSLLRAEAAVSEEQDFTEGHFREILGSPAVCEAKDVARVIFCSGKVYYDLLQYREASGIADAAIMRVEQIYPMNFDLLSKETEEFPKGAKWVWCQEEPMNMGAWNHILPVLGTFGRRYIHYAGRDVGSSPAVGSLAAHKREQECVVRAAFEV